MAEAHRTRNHWFVTHGHSFTGKTTGEYRSWRMMIQRCHNSKHTHFSFYGGRGITVCQQWRNSFERFLADMGLRPSSKHSIERRDNNGNYEPENCRWATRKEQMRNMRRNRLVTFDGETMCLSEWTEKLRFPRNLLKYRLDSGMSVEAAITTPIKPKGIQVCSVENCPSPCKGKGLCNKHYFQVKRHGKVMS